MKTHSIAIYAASVLLGLGLLYLTAAMALAQQPPGGGTPPAEAMAACSGLSAGDSCSFTGGQGESLTGVCNNTPDGSFACMPEGGPGGHGGQTAGTPPSQSGPSGGSPSANVSSDTSNQLQVLMQLVTLLQQLLTLSNSGADLNFDLSSILGSAGVSTGPSQSGPGGPQGPSQGQGPGGQPGQGPSGGTAFSRAEAESIDGLSLPDSDYYDAYTIEDDEHGTEVTVTLTSDQRRIVANALPNHETGDFPNSGNPNAISAQSDTYSFPAAGTYTGDPEWSQVPGVAVNGVKIEPETAERVECTTGETYKIEALQEMYDLGFDENNAHVQPTGAYHYHGVPELLVDDLDDGSDLVHIGFARDGHMIYYDTSGTVEPSWELSDDEREGSSCTYRNNTVDIDGTSPDGTYVSDWVFNADAGNLDECNGAYVDGEYAYFMTDDYPFIGRCIQG